MILPFKEFSHFTEQKAKKKSQMECQATETKIVSQRVYRGSQSASASTLLVFISSVSNNQGGGESLNWEWAFHFKPQIHKSNTNCSDGEN